MDFVENKGQSGPLSVVSKAPRQMSVVSLILDILAICKLSVNPIQTLLWADPFFVYW